MHFFIRSSQLSFLAIKKTKKEKGEVISQKIERNLVFNMNISRILISKISITLPKIQGNSDVVDNFTKKITDFVLLGSIVMGVYFLGKTLLAYHNDQSSEMEKGILGVVISVALGSISKLL